MLDGTHGWKQVWCPMFESEDFRKLMHCIEESNCDIVGTYRHPRSDSANRCLSRQSFGDAKDFCLNFPKLAQNVFV